MKFLPLMTVPSNKMQQKPLSLSQVVHLALKFEDFARTKKARREGGQLGSCLNKFKMK